VPDATLLLDNLEDSGVLFLLGRRQLRDHPGADQTRSYNHHR
jgi:hypothetical protein